MNKTEFIKELDKRLKYIPKEDRDDAIEYYTELLSDMEFGENDDVTAKLGSAKDAAKVILDECTEKHVRAYEEKHTVKGHATVVWLSVLGALSLPVSLPLAITVLIVAVALLITVFAVLLSLAISGVALVISGFAALIFAWMAPGFSQKAVVFGTGLLSLGLGILLCIGIYFLMRFIIRKIFRRDKTGSINRKEDTAIDVLAGENAEVTATKIADENNDTEAKNE